MTRTSRKIVPGILTALALAAFILPARSARAQELRASAILVNPVTSGEIKLPPDFQMALYEYLIARMRKTGRFKEVYRAGDQRAANVPDLVVMQEDLRDFKQGSELLRDVTTVSGATSIKVRLQITSNQGELLLDREVEGKVRFFGDNLRATDDLAKDVAKVVRENFAAAPAHPMAAANSSH